MIQFVVLSISDIILLYLFQWEESINQRFLKTLNRQLDYYGLSAEQVSKNERRCVEPFVKRNKVHISLDRAR